jgi:hypothetical protein
LTGGGLPPDAIMKMRTRAFGRGVLTAAGLACLLWASPQVHAQVRTWVGANLERMVEDARWRLGALRVNAAFSLANAGYDSDIYYGFLAEPTPDLTARAVVPVQVLLPLSKKVVLDVSDAPGYDFYLDASGERSWNNVLDGRLHIALNRIYIQAGGGMSDVRRRLSPELELNVRQKTDQLRGLVLWQASRSTSLALLYSGAQYAYDDVFYNGVNIADRLNRNEEYGDLIAYVQPSARIRLSLDGQYGSYQFRRSGPELRDAVSYAFFATAEFIPDIAIGDLEIVRGLRGQAALGYMMVDMKDPGRKDGSGLVGEADVTARLSRRTSGHVAFSRGFQFSVYSGSSFFLLTRAAAGLTRHLSRRAEIGYEFSYGTTSYPDSGTGGSEAEASHFYRYLTHSVNIGLRLGRQLSMSLLGSFGQRDRGGTEPLRNRFFAGISLTYGSVGQGMTGPMRGGIL